MKIRGGEGEEEAGGLGDAHGERGAMREPADQAGPSYLLAADGAERTREPGCVPKHVDVFTVHAYSPSRTRM